MKSDYYVMLINFILIGILSYCLYDYIFVPKKEPFMGQIKRGLVILVDSLDKSLV